MPCYFVSSGVEIPMTNETFDFIWNGFGNKELNDSETSSSPEENYKADSSVQKPTKPQWRKQDDGYYNRKPKTKRISKDITKRKRDNRVYAIYAAVPWAASQTNLAKHKKTKKCQRFFVWVHYDFMTQEKIIKL